MVTDGILGAITEMMNQATDDYEETIIQTVYNMLADFDEDHWDAMNELNRQEWIRSYR